MSAFQVRIVAPAEPDADSIDRVLTSVCDPDAGDSGAVSNRPTEAATRIRKEREERHTTHYWIESGGAVESSRYFVKRYRPPLVRNAFTFALPSRVAREYRNSRFAFERGLPVVPAIAYAERRRCGIVVDQVIVFRDVGRCRSASELIDHAKKSGDVVKLRGEILLQLGRDLRLLHEQGYSHLAASPRNYLKLIDSASFVFIDHNAAVAFPHSIHATDDAIADILNLFESRRLFPDVEARTRFLAAYAPDDADFRVGSERAFGEGRRSDSLARRQKIRRILSRDR